MNFEEALKLKSEKQIKNSSDFKIVCPHFIDDPIGNKSFIHNIPKFKFTDLDAKKYSTNEKYGIMDINIQVLNQYR
ncbi:hypothetical protein [Tenacibaculum finnmarkense]|uniref:hypothetical protein n=1 Tax=Tenacibaculum finnmarkense TaxID=2781243 RepID=UPI001E58FC19|nr:hypothetical protein [Tenacibaculum finnmarkense]MCD8410487.1 hypothetical protein [Tenacibaculum finnmarkense genomovar ulcerans]